MIPSTSLLGKLIRLPLNFIPNDASVRIISGVARGKKWIIGSGLHGYWLGWYESEKQKKLVSLLQKGHVVYDIGAHAGYYSILASTLVGETGHVYAFEPNPRNFSYVQKHISMNALTNVSANEEAISDVNGAAMFECAQGSSLGKLSPHGSRQVRTLTLDSLIQKGFRPPNLIKMDIEGGELAALNGARETLATYRPIVFLATHGPDIHRACCEFLISLGYELAPVSGTDVSTTDELVAICPA